MRKRLELAQYIADMLLELRNMAKAAGLKTLLGLLEISFCEAFSIANKVEIPAGEIEKLKRLVKSSRARGDLANYKFHGERRERPLPRPKIKTVVWHAHFRPQSCTHPPGHEQGEGSVRTQNGTRRRNP